MHTTFDLKPQTPVAVAKILRMTQLLIFEQSAASVFIMAIWVSWFTEYFEEWSDELQLIAKSLFSMTMNLIIL